MSDVGVGQLILRLEELGAFDGDGNLDAWVERMEGLQARVARLEGVLNLIGVTAKSALEEQCKS